MIHFKDEVIVTSTCGKSDIALFMMKVTKIFKDVYKYIPDIKTSNLEKKKIRMVKAAPKTIKSDTKMVKTEPVHPSLEDIENRGNVSMYSLASFLGFLYRYVAKKCF